MARWEEALDAQLDTYRAYSSPMGHEAAKAFGRAVIRDHPQQDGPGGIFRDLSSRFETALFNADPVYVDPDMMTVFEAAWPNFRPETLQPTDLCTTSGFMLLPRPVSLTDVHGKRTTYRAVLWEPVMARRAGVGVDRDEEPRGGVIVYLLHGTSAMDEDDYADPRDHKFTPFMIGHVMPWLFNDPDDNEHETHGDLRSVYRPVQCLWRLMMQTLAARTQERAGGQFRKRWEKAQLPEKKVTVVRLRRTYEEKETGDPRLVNWTHRWIVHGFWRAQWYDSIKQHRQIWISPFVKGPKDLPLIINKTHVFEFVR